MTTAEKILANAQFLVDAAGNKKAVVVDVELWEEILDLLEELEDAAELQQLRQADDEVVSWEQARAELRTDGVDV